MNNLFSLQIFSTLETASLLYIHHMRKSTYRYLKIVNLIVVTSINAVRWHALFISCHQYCHIQSLILRPLLEGSGGVAFSDRVIKVIQSVRRGGRVTFASFFVARFRITVNTCVRARSAVAGRCEEAEREKTAQRKMTRRRVI